MQQKQHLAGLDIIRFFAACLVMIFHFGVVSWRLPISPNFGVANAPDYPELSIFDVGWVGVEIFFVLSGLVIAQSADGKSAYKFLKGKASRLLPAIWICGTITLGVAVYFGMKSLGPVWSSYLKTIVVYPNGPWISNVYWTLIVEIAFYALIFVILLANLFKRIELFAGLLIGGSAIYLIGVVWFNFSLVQKYFLAQHGCFFGLGIVIWLISSKGLTLLRLVLATVAIVACIIEICFVSNGRLVGLSFFLAPLVWFAAGVGICVSIIWPSKGNEFLRMVGLMTYPLYLVHEKLGSGILRVAPWTGRWLALILAIAGAVCISFIVVRIEPYLRLWLERSIDWASTRYIPQPMLALLRREQRPWLPPKPQRPATP
jgi:exopolysaccharide production protein ExoZ